MTKKKKAATLIVINDTTFSDHTSQYVEVYELSLAPKMDCMAYEHRSYISHMNKWSHIFNNFMNILLGIPWKPEEFSCSWPVPRHAAAKAIM